MVPVSLIVIIFSAVLLIELSNGGWREDLRDKIRSTVSQEKMKSLCDGFRNRISIVERLAGHIPEDSGNSLSTGAFAKFCALTHNGISATENFFVDESSAGSSNLANVQYHFIVKILDCNGALVAFGNDAVSDIVITTEECAREIEIARQQMLQHGESVYAVFANGIAIPVKLVLPAAKTGLGVITLEFASHSPILVQHKEDAHNVGEHGTAACLFEENDGYREDTKQASVVGLGQPNDAESVLYVEITHPQTTHTLTHLRGSPYFDHLHGRQTLRGLYLGKVDGSEDRHRYQYVDQQMVLVTPAAAGEEMKQRKKKDKGPLVYGSGRTNAGLKIKD